MPPSGQPGACGRREAPYFPSIIFFAISANSPAFRQLPRVIPRRKMLRALWEVRLLAARRRSLLDPDLLAVVGVHALPHRREVSTQEPSHRTW